ncbi:MAG: MerR family DNA-binding protein [Pseudomonadota bacterium]
MGLLPLLRQTGMPLSEMTAFAALYRHGDATIAGRRAVLEGHRGRLRNRRAEVDRCEAELEEKLRLYDTLEGKSPCGS